MGAWQVLSMHFEKYIVDLGAKSCTCRRWGLCGIPCPHAIASIIERGLNIYDFVHPSLLLSCYGQV